MAVLPPVIAMNIVRRSRKDIWGDETKWCSNSIWYYLQMCLVLRHMCLRLCILCMPFNDCNFTAWQSIHSIYCSCYYCNVFHLSLGCKDVCQRFQNIGGGRYSVYELGFKRCSQCGIYIKFARSKVSVLQITSAIVCGLLISFSSFSEGDFDIIINS